MQNAKRAKIDETAKRIVEQDVYYCVSYLVRGLAKLEGMLKYAQMTEIGLDPDELRGVLIQDDWQSAAEEQGWAMGEDEVISKAGEENTYTDWQDLCSNENIDPHTTEAYEHWIVSDWLAKKLEDKGEMIVRDMMGLTIWGRPTTGQAIYMDYVMQRIAEDLNGPPGLTLILIDPFNRKVTKIESETPELDLHETYKLLDVNLITSVGLPNGDVIYVDDEGLLMNDLSKQGFFQYEGHPEPLAGKGLIVGSDGKGGNASAKTTLDEAVAKTKWMLYVSGNEQ
jgi:hypothetical protein